MESRHGLIKSFKFAFDGLKEGILKGRNFRIQVFLGVLAFGLAAFFKFSSTEFAILTLTVSGVIILELMNTAVESIVDIVSPEIKEKARIAKDVSAAAVLIASIASIIIGALIFLPKLAI